MKSVFCASLVALTVFLQANLSPVVAQQSAEIGQLPLMVLTGNNSNVKKPAYVRIDSAAEWKKVWDNHLGTKEQGSHRTALEIDFDRCLVIAIFQGDTWNNAGFEVESVRDASDQSVVRFVGKGYQTAGPNGGGDRVTPYAFIVLPKKNKEIVLEEHVRLMEERVRGTPPVIKEVVRLKPRSK